MLAPILVTLLLAAPAAAADAPRAGASVGTLPAWWSEPGRPGWTPTSLEAGALPWTLAGITAGAWRLDDAFAPNAAHFAGLFEAQAPVAWYDSIVVEYGGGAAWTGFGSTLASARGVMRAPSSRAPRAAWTLVDGDGGLERHGLMLSRGDERSWLRVGATAGKRSGIADMGPGADHLWGLESGAHRGAHTFDVRFAQRGSGEGQLGGASTVEESGRARDGSLGWRWASEGTSLGARWSRDVEQRTSDARVGGLFGARDLWTNAFELTGARGSGERAIEARLAWSESRAVRMVERARDFEAWNHTAWAALRAHAPVWGGRLEAALGAGHARDLAIRAQRWQLAPSAEWTREGRMRLRVHGQRALLPVWHSLDGDHAPGAFLQDTWSGGVEVSRERERLALHASLVAGSAGGRALLVRYPIGDISQRAGWAMDPDRYGFALAEAGGRWGVGAFAADARGYFVARDESRLQVNVDPSLGAAAGLEAHFALFSGDLDVRLRGDMGWVGERSTETTDPSFDERVLPGFATFGAGATMVVGDATILLRYDGIEDERQELGWLDPARYPDFVLARGAGRRMRFEVSWPLLN